MQEICILDPNKGQYWYWLLPNNDQAASKQKVSSKAFPSTPQNCPVGLWDLSSLLIPCHWHNKRSHPKCFFTHHIWGDAIMVWGAFFFNGTMELRVVQGHQTTAGFVEMLQGAFVMTEAPSSVCWWLFFSTQSPAHSSHRPPDKWLFSITSLYWTILHILLTSNPIENIWKWTAKECVQNWTSVLDSGCSSWSHPHHSDQPSHKPFRDSHIKHAQTNLTKMLELLINKRFVWTLWILLRRRNRVF